MLVYPAQASGGSVDLDIAGGRLDSLDITPRSIKSGVDSLASDSGERFSLVLTNPPFGKKSRIAVVNEEGELEKEDTACERQDFAASCWVRDNVLIVAQI